MRADMAFTILFSATGAGYERKKPLGVYIGGDYLI